MTWSEFQEQPRKIIPNAITVLRAVMSFFIPCLLFHPKPLFHWAALILFLVAAITDFLDGYIARHFSLESKIGKILDPTADKFLILIPLVSFAHLGLYSVWWVVPIFIREFLVTFCRIGWSLQGTAVGAEMIGKQKFFFQVVTVLLSFLCHVSIQTEFFAKSYSVLYFITMTSLVVSNVLTLLSGYSFWANNRKNFLEPSFLKYVTACGVGLIPIIPGTWGSAMGVFLAWLCSWNAFLYLFVLGGVLVSGFWAIRRMNLKGHEDPSFVVTDEVAGMMVSLFLIPASWEYLLIGFFLFRVFDVIKPFPLRRLENLPGFWGIMMDDIGAGIYTWLCLKIIL